MRLVLQKWVPSPDCLTKNDGALINITQPSLLNFAVTDGESVVCARYVSSDTLEAPSLYFSSGTKFESYEPGHYRMVKADRREDMVVVASGKNFF